MSQKLLSRLHELSTRYEDLISTADAKKNGIFYTPPSVVRKIVRDALGPRIVRKNREEILAMKILDPACGSGIFLLEILIFLTEHLRGLGHYSIKDSVAVLENCIFGVDQDEKAVELTRRILSLAIFEQPQLEMFQDAPLPDLKKNIKVGNSLLSPEDFNLNNTLDQEFAQKCQAFSWKENFPAVFEQGGFDCIVGNPPYGLSRDAQINPEENEKLRHAYAEYRSGKINKYLAFLAKGIQLLHPNGCLSFIVPNAWLGIRDGFALRKKFLKERLLQSIMVYDCPVFNEPSVETVVVTIDRSRRHNTIEISHVEDTTSHTISKHFKLPLKTCLNNPGFIIPTNWSEDVESVFEYLRGSCISMRSAASPFQPSIALQAYAKGKGTPPQSAEDVKNHIYHTDSKEGESAFPYLQGGDIGRYTLTWSGSYLKYGEWLAEPQSLERFQGPRILLREIINPLPYVLNACFTNETYLYNKSVLHILPKKNTSEEMLWALVAILNSKLGSFVIRFQGRKSQRKIFPKIVNDDLRDFPILQDPEAHLSKLATLSREISSLALSVHDRERLQTKIDDEVFAAYNLKNSHAAKIESLLISKHSRI